MLVKIENREYSDKKQSDQGLHSLSRQLVFEILQHCQGASLFTP